VDSRVSSPVSVASGGIENMSENVVPYRFKPFLGTQNSVSSTSYSEYIYQYSRANRRQQEYCDHAHLDVYVFKEVESVFGR